MKTLCILLSFLPLFLFSQPASKKAHVFIITTDGFRWQEFFQGADSLLLFRNAHASALSDPYWSSDLEERRKKLMPFIWTKLVQEGQLLGNRRYGNHVNVLNAFKISYPGYNEILSGFPDPVFIPNLRIRNRNLNILGQCNISDAYHGKVAAFTTWDLFPYILNQRRDHLILNSKCISDNKNDSPDERTFCNAMAYIKQSQPDLVFISFNETDRWAHNGDYIRYLQSAAKLDEMIGRLWEYVQNDPYYRNETTFIITTDHGRGQGKRWTNHGIFSSGSGKAWQALIGPDVLPLGEIKNAGDTYQTQIASTVAWLLHFPVPNGPMANAPILSAFHYPSQKDSVRFITKK